MSISRVLKCGPVEKKLDVLVHSPAAIVFIHYFALIVLGLTVWGFLWCAWGEPWQWDGEYFKLAAVAIVAWASSEALEGLTTLPPSLAALLVGILARNLNILDMRDYTSIDGFFRKIYPAIILGKASLGWNVDYMKSNWALIARLGILPWLAEVIAVAISTHYLLEFPWIWGFLLAAIYASHTCAIVMPSVHRVVMSVGATERNWGQLVCTAGGIDLILSVGVYGIIHSWIFFNTDHVHASVKVALTLFVGIFLGITWGSISGLTPQSRDIHVTVLRILFVLLGGLLVNFAAPVIGWLGIGGVAVLVCNGTAANFWARQGWKLNNNPASTAYRILWNIFEPMLYVYTGTFFIIRENSSLSNTMLMGFAILVISLLIRLMTTFIVTWNLTLKERLFACCAWIPKSIVEAVMCPLAINTLLQSGSTEGMQYANQLLELIIQNILITTLMGFLLTRHLGPILLKKPTQNDPEINSRNAPGQENETDSVK